MSSLRPRKENLSPLNSRKYIRQFHWFGPVWTRATNQALPDTPADARQLRPEKLNNVFVDKSPGVKRVLHGFPESLDATLAMSSW